MDNLQQQNIRERILFAPPSTLALWAMRPNDKIRAILQQPGWTQQKLAERLNVAQSTVNRWLRASAEPEGDNRDHIARLYEEVLDGEATPKVALKGKVGAGQAIYPLGEGDIDLVDAPPNASDSTVAVEVSGPSMLPVFFDGWLLYYSRQLPPDAMVNKIGVAQLSDGRLLVKTIRPGLSPGFWTLLSANADPIEDVAIEWVAPIDWIKPR